MTDQTSSPPAAYLTAAHPSATDVTAASSAAPIGRSKGSIRIARALWYTGIGKAEIRNTRLTPPPPGMLTIETHYSAISRGTERLVWSGKVPESEHARMRAPHQMGDFPFPVKYGYSAAGIVIDGPADWIGAKTFALHPHQDLFQVPTTSVVRLSDTLPLARATLAANMETALNALWDSGAGPGDRIVVIGAGIVGLLVARLAGRIPATRVTVVDVLAERQSLAERLGAGFATDASALGDEADIVFHTSASAGGLQAAIDAAGFEAALVELSWYGTNNVTINLGGAFHAKRLRLISSQVGHVAGTRRPRWNYARRLETAARLLDDPCLDQLLAERVAFDDVPDRLGAIFSGDAAKHEARHADSQGGQVGQGGLSPVIVYPPAT